jgi:hypothetical protein
MKNKIYLPCCVDPDEECTDCGFCKEENKKNKEYYYEKT